MRSLSSLVLVFLITATVVRADSTLAAVRLAQRMLGAETWTRVIRVENEGRSRRYPRVVYGLVFELAGLLWFYAPEDGTQSFSLHRDQLELEKADFGPLLRDIEPGFRRWTVLPEEADSTEPGSQSLPNGCFVQSVSALREWVTRGATVLRPRLLLYYFSPQARKPGHTVLMFETTEGVRVIDPDRKDREERLPSSLATDPLGVARRLEGRSVERARVVPLEAEPSTRLAGTGAGGVKVSREGA